MFSKSIRWVFVLFCSIFLAKKFSLSLKALQLNVTNVRTTRAHALKFETATMMMPVWPSTREVSTHSYLKKKIVFLYSNKLLKWFTHSHDPLTFHVFWQVSSLSYFLGGDTYRECIKYSDCVHSVISEKFPKISSFKFSCCTSDLCNTAPVSVSSRSVVGILLSLAFFWWGVL